MIYTTRNCKFEMEIKTPDMVRNSRNENKGPKWKFPLLMENNAKIGINTKMEIATLNGN